MKIYVLHDESGHIRGTVAATTDAYRFGARSPGGLRVLSVTTEDKTDEGLVTYLRDLHANHYVSLGHDEPKILRKKTA